MAPPTLTPIDIVQRTGHGVAVICEGENHTEDEFILSQWFGDRASEVTFFSQDGWPQVERVVNEMRAAHLGVPVFGLRDRDFLDSAGMAAQDADTFEGPILRLPVYTVENALLDPAGWHDVVTKDLWRRQGTPPPGWASTDEIRLRIEEYYKAALPAAAHNWVVNGLTSVHDQQRDFAKRKYVKAVSPNQTGSPALEDALGGWASGFACEDEARRRYRDRLAYLQGLGDVRDLAEYVSGKLVYNQIHAAIPYPGQRTRLDRQSLQDRYLNYRPEPPQDVTRVVQRILQLAAKQRAEV